ncbi:MAG TPA: serine/threonine-protein kinase [Ktedonobacterales bacterium]
MNDELIGQSMGHCVIRAVLGEGGMARVYRAYQENLDRDVAIKILPAHYAADENFVERFKLEARSMAKLSHPNIVTIHDAGADQGRLYIVMAYISGGTLKDRMGSPMDPRQVVRVIDDVAAALAYAHERGIVHRDVKPANVLLDENDRGVLSDFGIAKVLAATENLTRVGAGVGTPEYMSPEQCRGWTVDPRTDIYALGVMLYEMLTGRTPFVADNYTALAHAHIYERVPPPSQLNPRVSPAVQAVVLKALEKDPSQRFRGATDLAEALEEAVAAQVPVARGGHGGTGHPYPAAGHAGYGAPSPKSAPPMPCPRCRGLNAPWNKYCEFCGLPLVAGLPVPQSVAMGTAWPAGVRVTCPRCQAPNSPGNHFCTRCGTPLGGGPQPGPGTGMICPRCHHANARGERFCTSCGFAFE